MITHLTGGDKCLLVFAGKFFKSIKKPKSIITLGFKGNAIFKFYYAFLLRRAKPKPNKPKPNNAAPAGAGTAVDEKDTSLLAPFEVIAH
ncbi:MAG: hypothetical protein ACJAZP_001551 [Psychromonas sp.]|jgi:hypothetical protein